MVFRRRLDGANAGKAPDGFSVLTTPPPTVPVEPGPGSRVPLPGDRSRAPDGGASAGLAADRGLNLRAAAPGRTKARPEQRADAAEWKQESATQEVCSTSP